MKAFKLLLVAVFFLSYGCQKNEASEEKSIVFEINSAAPQQVIHNFGASDAWSCQFVGRNWPLEKRDQIADLLFSREFDQDGNPKGIGLTLWRFNIGAGSAGQGAASDIGDEWRRAESFLASDGTYDWGKQQGQRWFLNAAKEKGVEQFVAFVNSPPVNFTRNGKAYAGGGAQTNLKQEAVGVFADFLVRVLTHFEEQGISFDYISPVNEPQWDWDNAGQEGSPYLNSELADLVRTLNQALQEEGLATKIELPEAARIIDLYQNDLLPGRDDQLRAFFDPQSDYYLGGLSHVAQKVAAHSYFTTFPAATLKETRQSLNESITALNPEIEFWMSEYCILEDNSTIKGNGRDLGMNPAIYMAKVIHHDLVDAHANAWHWWLAVSPYDYKDGLVYIDHDKNDGAIYESKMLWTLGNYSLFVTPGMRRIGVQSAGGAAGQEGLLVSAFAGEGKIVAVIINSGYNEESVKLDFPEGEAGQFRMYVTSSASGDDLAYKGLVEISQPVELASRSVTTLVYEE